MPPGYSARCAACCSVHRSEIDKRLLGGESTRGISVWLGKSGEKISWSGLARHKREHLAVAEEVADRAAEAAVHFEAAVQQGLDDLAMHEEEAFGGHSLSRGARDWMMELLSAKERIPQFLVSVYMAGESAARQHAKDARGIRNAEPDGDVLAELQQCTDAKLEARIRDCERRRRALSEPDRRAGTSGAGTAGAKKI